MKEVHTCMYMYNLLCTEALVSLHACMHAHTDVCVCVWVCGCVGVWVWVCVVFFVQLCWHSNFNCTIVVWHCSHDICKYHSICIYTKSFGSVCHSI